MAFVNCSTARYLHRQTFAILNLDYVSFIGVAKNSSLVLFSANILVSTQTCKVGFLRDYSLCVSSLQLVAG